MELVLTLLVVLAFVGLIEYAGHRWLLHEKHISFGRDHLQHHKTFSHMRYEGLETPAGYDAIWIRCLFALAWSSLLSIPFVYYGMWTQAIILTVVTTTHGTVWAIVHNEMHRPTNYWIFRNRWFWYMKEFHRVHHKYPRSNYGFLFSPIYDFLFRTRRDLLVR